MTLHITLVNPNTSREITERLIHSARSVAASDVVITGRQPESGVPSVEGYYDGYLSVAACLNEVERWAQDQHALIWAGFGDVGREALQELVDVPVIGMAESAVTTALHLGRSYAVITTLARTIPMIDDVLRNSGLLERCTGIWATDLGVLASPDMLCEQAESQAIEALRNGADVVILGSAALSGFAPRLTQRVAAPVVDASQAAVGVAQSLARQASMITSRRPIAKTRTRVIVDPL